MVTLSARPKEGGTCVITISFTDADSVAVAPSSATWSLTDREGNVMNSRYQVTIASPSSSEDITLYGDDLADISTNGAERIFTVEGLYDTDTETDLPIRDQVKFIIDDLVDPIAP